MAACDEETCFLPICRQIIKLLGDIDGLIQKVDAFCFTYQHVHFLHTLSNIGSLGKMMKRMDICLMMCREQYVLNYEMGLNRRPSIAVKDYWRKGTKTLLSSFQKTKPTQIIGSVLVETSKQVSRTKFKLESKNFSDYFETLKVKKMVIW